MRFIDLERYLASKQFRLLPLYILLALGLLSAGANYWYLRDHAHNMARYYAEGIVRLINDARLWNAEHGGVYVPVSESTPPNPYLQIPHRDLVTLDGLELTMINPSYMTREIAEITRRQAGLVMHLTSARPINPGNRADEWEQQALVNLEQGRGSKLELVAVPEGMVFRYMSPLYIQPACLPCHQAYGYEEGDLRGGVSLVFPAAPHLAMVSSQINWMLFGHAIALVLIGSVTLSLLNRLQRQWQARQRLIDEQESTIAQRTQTLSSQMERYYTIINTAAEGYWEIDDQQRTAMVNEALCAMLEYDHEELMSRSPLDFVAGKNRDILREQLQEREISRIRAFKITLKTKSGRDLHTRFHTTSIFNEKRQFTGSFAFITDITELLEIRESAAAYALKLERSNKELEDFARVVSHDLQEPLRTMVSLGDRLLAKHAAGLDEKGRDYLSRMQDSASRMRQLIEDLRSYSREAHRKNQVMALVDLNEVLREVIADLEQRIGEQKARIEIDRLPTINADRSQLHRLFLNLVGNALKFQAEGNRPWVRVKLTKIDRKLAEIQVSDNGIGFEEKYLDRIFRPFQRLHGRGEYHGTGMGLAICKKIVENHHGEISARSTPGEGTTFSLTLPL